MSSSIKLNLIVSSLVSSAPPGELNDVGKDISTILSSETSTIGRSLEEFVNEHGAIFSHKYIASKYNKDPNSTKYIDYIGKKLFNIDISKQLAIDVEDYEPLVTYPLYFNDLVNLMESYGEDHYPSSYAFTIIPGDCEVKIVIIGQKLNQQNYYTGEWMSVYTVKDGSLEGSITLNIHYFEEGNVRMKFKDDVKESLSELNASSILNLINATENKLTLSIVKNFNELNQKSFKNLRRLLPVTRSKINWGKAIGNYRLGSDVVNQ
ncbi:uncharacterized protein PRCAT00006195001 [Priceomyces carsonii]|uniref:uncharacterized protein n=1 Tax=Priceomyces carsonii TaxID=28549 RepID=UPI002EDAD36F|nr:unnamed protein product [Priceomyces carsonii]